MPPAGKTRPLERLASASAVYGKCIAADFNNVQKDKCMTEFLKLKECYMAAYKKR
ncbi:hypothetical protein W97_06904 [Coniosporium apollinis CBS 100218]|uniref:IMS import disulfide relay-system CHCH-CHCH-like Cx9C domain-containing protein n=1 Tax=Coniosporium apollinis (strain CBS 100218) TaxID=1168221 RepID=R7Z0U2_CONA1|nr:uncharacterized protein W97_06904 [Coniosporium apollinis CBS 100218]EON67536.1 hypothetical protein W97_06904 [Coniosporium apollinis CBS 100218]